MKSRIVTETTYLPLKYKISYIVPYLWKHLYEHDGQCINEKGYFNENILYVNDKCEKLNRISCKELMIVVTN